MKQVFQEEPLLELQKRPWNPSSQVQDFLFGKHGEAKGVQRLRTNGDRAADSERSQGTCKVACRSAGESTN
jgi:hypothetical protein